MSPDQRPRHEHDDSPSEPTNGSYRDAHTFLYFLAWVFTVIVAWFVLLAIGLWIYGLLS